jgi:glutamine cyclotransferase
MEAATWPLRRLDWTATGVSASKLTPLLLTSVMLLACEQVTPSQGYQILQRYDHDPEAYTQGLLFHDGYLFESTGRYGTSTLRKVDVETGDVVASVSIDSTYFAEGLARVGSELVQLTWKAGIAFVYDTETFELTNLHNYSGEGWGLCFDGESLFMSDGSSQIFERDPETFDILSEISVQNEGVTLRQLNELECVGEFIYANVYQTNRIVKINKRTGEVVSEIDGYSLALLAGRQNDVDAVLNGIAYIEETDVFLVTGKLWETLFAIRMTGF